MKSSLAWIALSLLLGTGLIVQTVTKERSRLKTAYVSNAKLYTEFLLARELDAQLQRVRTTRQTILDSLELRLDALERPIAAEEADEQTRLAFRRLQQEYALKEQQFAEDNQLLTQRYQEQIATQLNQYLADYTEQEGYDYIFGATGSGSLMGAKDDYDITDAVLAYANERYNGKRR